LRSVSRLTASSVGVRQRDGLLGTAAVFVLQHELHVDGIGVANRDGGLQPLEENLKLAAEGIGTGFELAKILHLCLYYIGLSYNGLSLNYANSRTHSPAPIPPGGPGNRPSPPRAKVQVRVDAVGICGSDLHSYSEGAVGDTLAVYPMVLGHEPAGTVVRVGSGVTGWHVGDRATLEPALYCYHCEYCRAGRHNVCANIRFLSTIGNRRILPRIRESAALESAGHSAGDVDGTGRAGGTAGRRVHSLKLALAASGRKSGGIGARAPSGCSPLRA
jgi:hypothetical protein